MAGGGGVGGKEEERREQVREPPLVCVVALPAMALSAVVSRLEAAVPRKARSCLPRAAPSAWWSCRIPVLPPPLSKYPAEAEEEERRRFPRPQRVRVAPSSPDPATAAAAEQPAKKGRRCLHCDAAETPQWRSGPMGRGTLCNACGVWYGTTGALPEHRPAARLITDPPPDSPIWEAEVPGAIYLVRKTAKQTRPSEAAPATSCLNCGSSEPPKRREGPMGRREVCNDCGVRYRKGRLLPECRPAAGPIADSPPESPVAVSPPESPIWEPEARPAVYLARKPAKRGRPARTEAAPVPRSCFHCGSSETPQWREGPMGRGTLCNACGVRYKQGRLLPEYRPMGSPTFVPSVHANHHRRVLELHRKRQRKDQHPPPPATPTSVPSEHANTHRRVLELRRKRQRKDQHPPPPATPTSVPSEHANTHRRVLELRRKQKTNDQHPPPPPDDSVINPPTIRDDHPVDAPSSLDSLLLDGPSAPLIVESDEFLIS